MIVRLSAFAIVGLAALLSMERLAPSTAIFKENFDSLPAGKSIGEQKGWQAFVGFPGKSPPSARVVAGGGVNKSAALAITHDAEFRGYGMRVALPAPVRDGVVWMQCRFKPPAKWTSGLFFDASAATQGTVARIAAEPFVSAEKRPLLRWHAAWQSDNFRLYTETPVKSDHWYSLTARIDLDRGTHAAWVDDQVLGEDLLLCAAPPITQLYINGGGTKESPAYIDDIIVTREAPAGYKLRELLPQPKKDLQFRFAAVGDPQLGFGGYELDKIRFRQAVQQINEAGAEFTLVLGDMVHDKNNEQAYKDLKALAQGLKQPCYYVRGNHETKELYLRHFQPKLDYAFTHKGWRFVMIDAEGNHTGLSNEQLTWIADQFRQADQLREELVICLHVSPWENNEKGRDKYNQIGKGRDELRALLAKHKALLSLSGHYHRGLWHAREEHTNYLVLGGTALVRFGHTGWCVCDVYADRIEITEKPLFFAYERPGEKRYYHLPYLRWDDYASTRQRHPYLQQGPLVIARHRPAK